MLQLEVLIFEGRAAVDGGHSSAVVVDEISAFKK